MHQRALPSIVRQLRPIPQTASFSSSANDDLDPVQKGFLSEQCILVDKNDHAVGAASKRECHLWQNIESGGMLHRAFSVFLFDRQRRLLLQQRANTKITFPELWTNTCCSHPLDTPEERANDPFGIGVLRAAQRKLNHELGIKGSEVPLEAMTIVHRLAYRAKASDEVWGEHEMDYVIALQADVELKPNPNEVQAVRFVRRKELAPLMSDPSFHVTPWFNLIVKMGFVEQMWANLHQLSFIQNLEIIHDKDA